MTRGRAAAPAVKVTLTLIVLQEFVGANVPDFHRVVCASGRDAGAARVKVSIVHISKNNSRDDCVCVIQV